MARTRDILTNAIAARKAECKDESEQREADFHLLSLFLFTWHLTWSIL